jgi:hypothetical protein
VAESGRLVLVGGLVDLVGGVQIGQARVAVRRNRRGALSLLVDGRLA